MPRRQSPLRQIARERDATIARVNSRPSRLPEDPIEREMLFATERERVESIRKIPGRELSDDDLVLRIQWEHPVNPMDIALADHRGLRGRVLETFAERRVK